MPAAAKYQICMATPLAIAYNFISPNAYDDFVPAYTAHLRAEFLRISDALPHGEIAYQWDVCPGSPDVGGLLRPRGSPGPDPRLARRHRRHGAGRYRSRLPFVLRQSAGRAHGAAQRSRGLRGDGQRHFGRGRTPAPVHPHAGAEGPRRRGVFPPARRSRSARGHGALSRAGARGRPGGQRAQARPRRASSRPSPASPPNAASGAATRTRSPTCWSSTACWPRRVRPGRGSGDRRGGGATGSAAPRRAPPGRAGRRSPWAGGRSARRRYR